MGNINEIAGKAPKDTTILFGKLFQLKCNMEELDCANNTIARSIDKIEGSIPEECANEKCLENPITICECLDALISKSSNNLNFANKNSRRLNSLV